MWRERAAARRKAFFKARWPGPPNRCKVADAVYASHSAILCVSVVGVYAEVATIYGFSRRKPVLLLAFTHITSRMGFTCFEKLHGSRRPQCCL